MLADRTEGGQEALGVPSRLELLHHSRTCLSRLMGVLGSVVQIPTLAMLHTWQHLPRRGPIAAQLVGDEHPWHIHAALEQLAKELLGGPLVSAAVDEDAEYLPVLVDGPAEKMCLPVDLVEDFVQLPLVAW